ncbi:MAG: hypothetical protein UE970_10020 [Catenibacillus sp.]|nr:hypothetical protein [Catenibacillus sp.]
MAYEVSDTLKWMGRRMNDAEVSGVGVVGLCVNPAVFAGCGKPGKICGQRFVHGFFSGFPWTADRIFHKSTTYIVTGRGERTLIHGQ